MNPGLAGQRTGAEELSLPSVIPLRVEAAQELPILGLHEVGRVPCFVLRL